MPVTGIGGLFFCTRNREQLLAWYRDHLGVEGGMRPDGAKTDDSWVWQTAAGPVVFAPFKIIPTRTNRRGALVPRHRRGDGFTLRPELE
jgi:hypothetical protein